MTAFLKLQNRSFSSLLARQYGGAAPAVSMAASQAVSSPVQASQEASAAAVAAAVAAEAALQSSSVKLLESGRKWHLIPSIFAPYGKPTKTLLFREHLLPPQLVIQRAVAGAGANGSLTSSVSSYIKNYQAPLPSQESQEQTAEAIEKRHEAEIAMPTQMRQQDPIIDALAQHMRVEEHHCATDVYSHTPYFKMSNFNYEVVRLAFAKAGFKRIDEHDFNVFWGRHLRPEQYQFLNGFQRVNHFPGSTQLGRKDMLHINLHRSKHTYGTGEYGFFPNCYLLPYDNDLFSREIAKDPNRLFISKPFASSCGRGIRVVKANDPSLFEKPNLVQEYLDNPLLINGYKFDMRLYVLVTSYDPLRIYLFNEGLVRFATQPYNNESLEDRFAHLTNYSVNKHAKNFVANVDAESDDVGNKWSIAALRRYLKNNNIDDSKMWSNIEDIINKTLISVESGINLRLKKGLTWNTSGHAQSVGLSGETQQPQVTIVDNTTNTDLTHRNPCYELYGFDVMVDADLKPWLIEVNIMPSLACGSPLDKKIKSAAITQMYQLMGVVPYNRSDLEGETKRLLDYLPRTQQLSGVLPSLSRSDKYAIHDSEDELFRKGDYKRIYPAEEDPRKYEHLFAWKRRNNEALMAFEEEKKRTSNLSDLYAQVSK